jgi:hypothetical protein
MGVWGRLPAVRWFSGDGISPSRPVYQSRRQPLRSRELAPDFLFVVFKRITFAVKIDHFIDGIYIE